MPVVLEQEAAGMFSLCDDAMQVIHDGAECPHCCSNKAVPLWLVSSGNCVWAGARG